MSSPAQPATQAATPTPDALDIGLVSPGDRTDRLTDPLAAVDGTWTVNPSDPTAHDVIVCDTPDRDMLRAVARCRLDGTPVLFRQRGDPFWGIDEWLDSRVKKAVLARMLRAVDGCLAIAPHQASKFARKTGVPVDLVTLPKAVDEWPDSIHKDTELRVLTLTNCVYPDKIAPLAEIAPVVDDVLADAGGTWRIGSWSEGHDDWLREQLANYDHIEFGLRLDAHDELEWANAMLHHSRLDVLPNAILEGLASRLPVLTNAHVAFRQSPAPLTITRTDEALREALTRFREPAHRRAAGERGYEYVARNHAPADVGESLLAAIQRLIGGGGR
jgi:hypothetical protein